MKLNILFIINKQKANSLGKCTLLCRLTYRKTRKSFSTGLVINPDFWNSRKQKVLDCSEQSEYLNTQLSLIRQNLNQAFFLQVRGSSFTVIDIYNQC